MSDFVIIICLMMFLIASISMAIGYIKRDRDYYYFSTIIITVAILLKWKITWA